MTISKNKNSQVDESTLGDNTLAIRAGVERSSFGEHGEPIMTTSSYVFNSAEDAAGCFSGDVEGLIYSRFTNPTVQAFERRLAALEKTERCIGTSSGMAAINMVLMGTMRQGENIVATRNMFGSTVNLFKNFLPRFGVETQWANSFEPSEWAALINKNTRYLYLETPTNPLTEIADIAALSEVAHSAGVQLIVDNCFCTPALQKPVELGADIVIHSATKYLDGQGRCIGGAVAGSEELVDELTSYMRSAGPSMSPFNAWVFLKGLETLSMRMKEHSSNASQIAHWLEQQASVSKVNYPGLESHPQHELGKRQQRMPGGIISFEVSGGQEAAWKVIDSTQLCSITGNLGDVRTTITHPSSTTHGRMSDEDRAVAGINDGLIRLSIGLEDADDIQADLARGLV